MINPSFDEIKKVNNSRYAIAMIISKRARKFKKALSHLLILKGKSLLLLRLTN